MLNKIKQYFCAHDFHNVNGYDVNGVYWVVEYRCKKCGKIKFEKLYYPPKCLITGKYCDNENILDIDCRYCFRFTSLSSREKEKTMQDLGKDLGYISDPCPNCGKGMPTYNSFSKSEQTIVDKIAVPWVIDKEEVAAIFVAYEKMPAVTSHVVTREAFNRVLTRKGE